MTNLGQDENRPIEKQHPKSRGRKTVMTYKEDEYRFVPTAPRTKTESRPDKEYSFTFIEFYKVENPRVYDYSKVMVYSEGLARISKDILGHTDEGMWNETEALLRAPYKSIVYSWDRLLQRTVAPEEEESDAEREAREDLAELLDYIKNSQELREYFESRDSDDARSVTSFKYLWTLFPPGTDVVASPFMGFQQLFTISSVDKVSGHWSLNCLALDFETSFETRETCFHVMGFEETKSITALECYPVKYMDDEQTFRKSCAQRGKEFKSLCFGLKGAGRVFSYEGDVMSSGIGLNAVMSSLQHSVCSLIHLQPSQASLRHII